MKSWSDLIDRCLLFTDGNKSTIKELLREAERELVRNADILEKTYTATPREGKPSIQLPTDYKKPIAVWVNGKRIKPLGEYDVYRKSDNTLNDGEPNGYYVRAYTMFFDKIPKTTDKIMINYYATLSMSNQAQDFAINQIFRFDESPSQFKYNLHPTYDWIYYSLYPTVAWHNYQDIAVKAGGGLNPENKPLPQVDLTVTDGVITGAALKNQPVCMRFLTTELSGVTGVTGKQQYKSTSSYAIESANHYAITGGGSGASLSWSWAGVAGAGGTNTLQSVSVTNGGTNYGRLKIALNADVGDALNGQKIRLPRVKQEKLIYLALTNTFPISNNENYGPHTLNSYLTAELSDHYYDYENEVSIYTVSNYSEDANEFDDFINHDNRIDTGDDYSNGLNEKVNAEITEIRRTEDGSDLIEDPQHDDVIIHDLFGDIYPIIPAQYHLSLCDYAIAILNARSNEELYQKHWAKWMSEVERVALEDADRDLPHSIRTEI
jgi:hypothetical protein